MLKERLFGVGGPQGNHGEDVKELYYYLDSTPTHSYMKFLYKYTQKAYPYEQLVEENRMRSREVAEYEILDSDAFEEDRYWDVFAEVGHLLSPPSSRLLRLFFVVLSLSDLLFYLPCTHSTRKTKTHPTTSTSVSQPTTAVLTPPRFTSSLNSGSLTSGPGRSLRPRNRR